MEEYKMANLQHNAPLSNLETAAFCNQMAMILKSGISTLEGISVLLEDAQNDSERELLTNLKETIEQTGSLAEAAETSGVFPAYFVQMLHLGEATGTLDEVMYSLGIHYSREDSLSRTIKNALTYPLIMICMMLLVIIVLITKVMPIFNQVFLQLGQEMTGFSKGILNLGQIMSRYALVFAIIAAVVVVLILYMAKAKNGKALRMRLGYHIAYTRNIYEKTAACRFADGMSLTLKSGMSPEQGVELAGSLVENPYFQEKLTECRSLIDEGTDLSEAFAQSKIFTGVYARMASIAGKSGVMDEVMTKIASQYEEDVDTQITSLIAAIEPTLVIILSVIVGAILFSVMLPLLGIMTGL
jgi:type IV pilus assembly protein PilC